MRRLSIINPVPLVDSLPAAESWGTDPIHPLPAVHQELAKVIIRNTDYLVGKTAADHHHREEGECEFAPAAKRSKEWSNPNRSWHHEGNRASSSSYHEQDGFRGHSGRGESSSYYRGRGGRTRYRGAGGGGDRHPRPRFY